LQGGKGWISDRSDCHWLIRDCQGFLWLESAFPPWFEICTKFYFGNENDTKLIEECNRTNQDTPFAGLLCLHLFTTWWIKLYELKKMIQEIVESTEWIFLSAWVNLINHWIIYKKIMNARPTNISI
jgi:hypothetical protein